MKGALPIPHIVALIIGVVVIGILGYIFVDRVSTGGTADCDAIKLGYCKGLIPSWPSRCGKDPKTSGSCDVGSPSSSSNCPAKTCNEVSIEACEGGDLYTHCGCKSSKGTGDADIGKLDCGTSSCYCVR